MTYDSPSEFGPAERRAILIMGPTASGKSALALALAEKLGGEVVNADSMQVYRDLRILTARPSTTDEARAPHHLYGHVDAAERYSVGRWHAEVLPVIHAILKRRRWPIVVGGTGLYFKALTQGLADIPAADPDLRDQLRMMAETEGVEALHAALARIDPAVAARLSHHDLPRILRALEVWETTGASISEYQAATQPALAASEWVGMVLTPDRADLYEAIEGRFDAMLSAGALSEVRALATRNLDPALPIMKAHGMPVLVGHLLGDQSIAEATELAKRHTRRYAKRQFTWIAHQMSDWPCIAAASLERRMSAALALLG